MSVSPSQKTEENITYLKGYQHTHECNKHWASEPHALLGYPSVIKHFMYVGKRRDDDENEEYVSCDKP